MATAPNMNLLLPDPTITPGPTYASENNTAFQVIDSHDHTFGKGLPIPAAALNINSDLSFGAFNATNLRSVQFVSQATPLSLPTDINSLSVVLGNLVYNNNLGQPVQITSGAALNASSIGGIGGDYGTSTALEFYTSADQTFTFWSNTNVPANIDAGHVTFRNVTSGSAGVTLAPNASIVSSYQLTFPIALPAAEGAMGVDASGNISFNAGGIVPVGAMVMFGGATAPSGYLICDGSAVSRSSFSLLFTAIGTAYGIGDGTTSFNIPDLRGLFPRGVDAGSGNDPDTLTRTATNGGNSGDNVGSVQVDSVTDHEHFILSGHNQAFILNNGSSTNQGYTTGAANGVGMTVGGTVNSTISSTAISTETRPKNVYVNYIIKT